MSILGNRVQRTEDPRLLTGAGGYVDNVPLSDALFVTFVTSTMAHAQLVRVDTSLAEALEGVIGVYTSDNIGLGDLPCLLPAGLVPGFEGANPEMLRPILARDRVRFVGEPIVAILSDSRYTGADAADLIDIEYRPLPAVVDPEVAATDRTVLFESANTNLVSQIVQGTEGDPVADAEIIIEQRIVNQRVAPAPLETRGAAANFADGKLTFYAATQGASDCRAMLAAFLGIDSAVIRVIAADGGGGFGVKGLISPEELVIASLAIKTGRPVRWAETRSQNLVAMPHGRGQIQHLQLGAKGDGTLSAADLTSFKTAAPTLMPRLYGVAVFTGSGPHGQGHETTWAMIAADRLSSDGVDHSSVWRY